MDLLEVKKSLKVKMGGSAQASNEHLSPLKFHGVMLGMNSKPPVNEERPKARMYGAVAEERSAATTFGLHE